MSLSDNMTYTLPTWTNETTVLSQKQQLEQIKAYQISISILIYVLPVIIIMGTIGNILSFIIWMKRKLRRTSTFFYLAMLAISDTVFLLISGLKTWIRMWSYIELLHVSVFSCKVIIFIINSSLHISAWLIVAVTTERFLAVWFPLRANGMCSFRRVKIVTATIVTVFLLLNSHFFWTAELVSTDNPESPDKLECTSKMIKICVYFPWFNMVLFSVIPSVLLLILNLLIIFCLLKHRETLKSAMTKDDQHMRSIHRRLAVILLTISFVWIFTTVPNTLTSITKKSRKDLESLAEAILLRVLSYILLYINHAINFFLYCLTGRLFRIELKKLFCCKSQKKHRQIIVFKASNNDSAHPLMEQHKIQIVYKRSQ
ncbi:probable G-protein coupled receptor 139 [Octopus bimaculoides]|uniref:G-protein coupled receptors family 1 profile domain-containing protein n=1 Tax=Octopus bimaculoides TaxID=37653 RepID=A0A0L8FRC6_OCTBM|nr:probable G-protein coupled receptor 139 [Octopus bimaculoides]XP_014787601.1 probable G-protein coupled receptor 139 [Octopus bimaculoides]|eukprot:XP_014787600.1 PREDICTED: thyrotropin-releasing hormone receptor-like [Octopus bimaculoides]